MKHLLTIKCSFLLLKANAQQLPTYSLYDLELGYAFTNKKDDEEHIRGTHMIKAGFSFNKF
jgi:hypothetical protein